MRFEEFSLLLYEHIEVYLLILVFNSAIAYAFFKNRILSIIDPLLLPVIYAVFANTVPIFLFYNGAISASSFIYFLCSVSIFWFAFSLNKRIIIPSDTSFKDDLRISKFVFYICFVIWLIIKVVTYSLQGIPIFLESRLTLYSESGGLGVLGRIETIIALFCTLYSFYVLDEKRSGRFIAYLYLFLWAISAVLSGSKSAFLNLISIAFFYMFFVARRKIKLKKFVKYFVLAIVCAVLVIVIQRGSDLGNAFLMLVIRFVASGDIYWEAYPLGLENSIIIENPMLHVFQGLLGGLRFIDYSDPAIGTALGFQVHWTVYPELADKALGPNARIPILSYVMYGWGGLLFSFIVGYLVSFVTFKLYSFFPKGLLGTTMYAVCYMNALSYITDPILGSSNLFNTILGCLLLLFIALISNLIIKGFDKNLNCNSCS